MAGNSYLEELPESCPPADASRQMLTAYRIVEQFPPAEADFHSQRKKFPTRVFSLDECTVRACSVFDNVFDIGKKKKLLVNRKIVKFTIFPQDGMVKKTLSHGHHSWWVSGELDFSGKEYEEVDE